MSELNLLVFGCAVSFVAVGGVYVYLRESFESAYQRSRSEARKAEVVEGRFRDVG